MTVGALMVVLLTLSASALASEVSKHGGAYGLAGSPSTFGFTNDPTGNCAQTFAFNLNDRFTFNDLHVNNNVAGGVAWQITYTVDLFEWVGGARGPHIDGKWEVITSQPGQTLQNTQTVTGLYMNWNGPNSHCTFEVYRTMTAAGMFASSDIVY
jgi:hypothetical protein